MSHPTDGVTDKLVREAKACMLEATGIRMPRATLAEQVTVFICEEATPEGMDVGKPKEVFAVYVDQDVGKPKEVFAVYVDYDATPPDSLKEWRAEGKSLGMVRDFIPHNGVIINESDIASGLAAPRLVLLGRDVSRLVMSAAAFQERTRLRASGLAKLTPEEREALGL